MILPMMHTDPAPDLAVHVRGEILAELARRFTTRERLAEILDKHPDWVRRRLAGTVGIDLHDLQVIADGLGIEPIELMPGANRLLNPL